MTNRTTTTTERPAGEGRSAGEGRMKRPSPEQFPPLPKIMQCPECGTELVSDPGSCYYCPGDVDGECPGFDTYDLEDEEIDELFD